MFDVHLLCLGSSLLENLSSWVTKGGMLLYMPFFFIWNLWKTRNNYIFEDKEPIISRLCHVIILDVASHQVPQVNRSKVRLIGDPTAKKFPMVFFDGVAEDSIGGVGVCIWLNEKHSLSIKLGCGHNTNNRAELLALWASLYIAKDIGLPYLHIFGNSSVIIKWARDECTLAMVNLETWCINTRKLKSLFTFVDFSHVFREHNKRVDTLSKEGINMVAGHLSLTEICDDEVYGEVTLHLF